MGIFRKRDRIVDLTERYKKEQTQANEIKREIKEEKSSNPFGLVKEGAFSIFGSATPEPQPTTLPDKVDLNLDPEERKRKLAKRLADMSTRLEDLSNQIYHLTQRLEVIEKKLNVNKFG